MSDDHDDTDCGGRRERSQVEASDATSPEHAPESDYVVRRRPLWPVFAVLGAIAASVAGGAMWWVKRPDPFQVLVAIEVQGTWWEGSRPAALLADRVGEGLKAIGFDPVAGGDPEVEKKLSGAKSPESAARTLRAGFVVTGDLAPEVIEHPVEGGLVEVRTKATLTVRFVGDSEGRATEVPIASWAAGRTQDEALAKLAESVSDRVFDGVLPAMVEHPSIREKLTGSDVGDVTRLQEAKKYVDSRTRRLDAARAAYTKVDQAHVASAGDPFPIEYLGSFSEQTSLAGIGPRGALVQTGDVSPFIVPSSLEMGWVYSLETLAWRSADRKDAPLWSGYHLLGYASAAPAGGPVLLVEDLFGRAKTLTVVEPDGSSRRLRVDAKARFDAPDVAPGGQHAALYERACLRCGRSFTVVALSDGKPVYFRAAATDEAQDEAAESYGGYAWLGEREVAFLVAATPAPDAEAATPLVQELRAVDLGANPPSDRRIARNDSECAQLAASPATASLVMVCASPGGDVLTFVDARSGDRKITEIRGRNPRFSPDGARIVFEHRGDIALLDLASQRVTELTKNTFSERAPRFSDDGSHVYFESRQIDPNFSRRMASVVARVAVPR